MGTMRIQDMFQKDIDRPINGVIKVAEKSDETVEQELSEYVVTHELGFAENVSDRVIFMENGSIVEDAPSGKFFSDPEKKRTREFLATFIER